MAVCQNNPMIGLESTNCLFESYPVPIIPREPLVWFTSYFMRSRLTLKSVPSYVSYCLTCSYANIHSLNHRKIFTYLNLINVQPLSDSRESYLFTNFAILFYVEQQMQNGRYEGIFFYLFIDSFGLSVSVNNETKVKFWNSAVIIKLSVQNKTTSSHN